MKALESIRVIDLTQAMAAPLGTITLADMGAGAIKVEPPERPGVGHDALRAVNPRLTYCAISFGGTGPYAARGGYPRCSRRPWPSRCGSRPSTGAPAQAPKPLGSAHRLAAPYQAIRAGDGYFTVGANTDRYSQAEREALRETRVV